MELSELASALDPEDPAVGLRAVGALHRLAEGLEAKLSQASSVRRDHTIAAMAVAVRSPSVMAGWDDAHFGRSRQINHKFPGQLWNSGQHL